MKIIISILICRIVYAIGKLIGKGSSLPGKIVLKLFPDILSRIKMPKTVIAVSGSNGKTSTVEMIAHALIGHGVRVIYNKEGSNQIEGVATFLLNNCSMKGVVKADVVLLESDERYARLTFRHFTPTHYVITNLYRDQMTRNAHSEWIYNILLDSIDTKTTLVLNANDPLVSRFSRVVSADNVVYFAMDENKYSTKKPVGKYNDGAYCPVCKHPLDYEYYNMAHIGKFECKYCGLRTEDALCRVTSVDLDKLNIVFDGEYKIDLAFGSTYNVYNLLAAYTILTHLGYDRAKTAELLGGYVMKNGRVKTRRVNSHNFTLLTSKHENSVSYNQSIDYAARRENPYVVMFVVDSISRKYYTCETSWLFDINFEALAKSRCEKIVLSGKYAYDLALRFEYTGIPKKKVVVESDIKKATDIFINAPTHEDSELFHITCFSDRDKVMGLFPKK